MDERSGADVIVKAGARSPGEKSTCNPKLRIGVLALQGDFEAHLKALQQAASELGIEVEGKAIRLPRQLDDLDGIIIPGGESTTIGKLIVLYGFQEVLQRK